jgi:hypothetical protein
MTGINELDSDHASLMRLRPLPLQGEWLPHRAPSPTICGPIRLLMREKGIDRYANLFTLTSDMFPKQAIGSVVGFGGTAGAIGGMLIAKVTASVLQYTGSYVPVFIIAASAYLLALLMVHLLSPRLEPAPIK